MENTCSLAVSNPYHYSAHAPSMHWCPRSWVCSDINNDAFGHNSALTKTDTSTSHIAPQCLHALLIIGGVEVNPGPDRELNIEEQDTIVAGLCAEAPNNDVRDTLRLYDPRLDTRALVKQLSRASKNSLVESLSYLGHEQ